MKCWCMIDRPKKFHSMYDTYILECDNIYFVFCRQTSNNISWNVIIWGNLLDVTHRRYKWRTLRMKYHNIIQLTPCIWDITLQWFVFTTLPCLLPQAIRIIKCKISVSIDIQDVEVTHFVGKRQGVKLSMCMSLWN